MKPYKIVDVAAILTVIGFCVYAGVFSLGPDRAVGQPVSAGTEVAGVQPARQEPDNRPEGQDRWFADVLWSQSANTQDDVAAADSFFANGLSSEWVSEESKNPARSNSARDSVVIAAPTSRSNSGMSSGSSSASSARLTGTAGSSAGGFAASASGGSTSPSSSSTLHRGQGNHSSGDLPVFRGAQKTTKEEVLTNYVEIYEPQKNIADVFNAAQEVVQNRKQLSLSEAIQNLLKYDAFWYAQAIEDNHPLAWQYLREKYPNRLALLYVSPFTVALNSHWSGLDLDYIEKYHPEWFLVRDFQNTSPEDYKKPDVRMRWDPYHPKIYNYNRFFLDIGNPDFRRWAISEFMKKLERGSGVSSGKYSGLAVDNLLLDSWVNLQTKRYPRWKYAGENIKWVQSFLVYMEELHTALRGKGYHLIANHTANYGSNSDADIFQKLMEVTDGLVDERCLMNAGGHLWGGTQWEWSLKNHEKILEKGLYDWWIFVPDTKDSEMLKEHFYYIFCSFLLIKDQQYSLFGTILRKEGAVLDSWFEEYNLPLGLPQGARYFMDGCWVRDYTNGTIVVNPTSMPHTFFVRGDTYALNWQTKEKVRSVYLPPLSAVILLPTPYKN